MGSDPENSELPEEINRETTILCEDSAILDKISEVFKELNVRETISKTSSNGEFIITINVKPKPTDLKLKKRVINEEKDTLKALAKIERSMDVDLCYVLDCTGSMNSHIAAAKDCILQVVEYIKNTNPRIKIKVGFCGYRDHCDGDSRIQLYNFTDSYQDFRRYLTKVPAKGGDDLPEDVLGGLNAAITKMNWRSGTKVLFHIGDYPPHGKRFTNLRDKYPDGDPNGLTAESVLKKMKSKDINYFFGKITDHTDTMIQVFRGVIKEFQIFELVGGDPIDLINKFVAATTTCITSSVLLASKDIYSPKQERDLNENEPDWERQRLRKGALLYYLIPKNVEQLKDLSFFARENLIAKNFRFKVALEPFSSGKEKYAYYAINTKSNPPGQVIMKEFVENEGAVRKYLDSVEISTVATYLAMKFNSIAGEKNCNFVNFLRVYFVRAIIDNKTRYYIAEPRLQGAEYKRFNTNGGIVVEYHDTLEAFSHFTYDHTEGYLVVTDLQGIKHPDRFLLTDAAIHCKDPRFGRTNLGSGGIKRCFVNNHKCNDVCKKLGLIALAM